MADDYEIVSGFGFKDAQYPFAVDFSRAKRLDRHGTTCDTFECFVQQRRLFVKRLKAEYRNNPLYRAAFQKEYSIGVGLSHASLPRYVSFGDDYIVMDFIEGDTLADLMRRDDPRLKNKACVNTLLGQLIDVVEYLHNSNVVHCDIKPDNIIVSPYADRPITLIDLDKAYTSWLETTHGNPGKYGCDRCADGQIDFRGIGLIAERLGHKRLSRAVGKDDVTAISLKASLSPNRKVLWVVPLAIAAAAAVTAGVLLVSRPQAELATPAPEVVQDTIVVENQTPVQAAKPRKKPAIDIAVIDAMIAEKADSIKDYRRELWAILDSDTISLSRKRDAIGDYTYACGLACTSIIYGAVSRYRDVSELDVQMAVRTHPAWIRLEKEEEENQARIRAWDAKVSRRSSDRPASQPDTTPGDTLPAPHR